MNDHLLQLFALRGSETLGAAVADDLGVTLAPHEAREFGDHEHKTRPLAAVRGADVYVLQSLYCEPGWSVNDKLVQLLFFVGACADAGAARVTVVAPYLCYSRKDRRTQLRDPLSSRYLATLFESVDTAQVVTIDVHNLSAFENAFRRPTVHLECHELFADAFVDRVRPDYPVAVLSPDLGGVKRAAAFRDMLEEKMGRAVGMGFMEKYRSGGELSGETLALDAERATVIIYDDLISSGGTMSRAAEACMEAGAHEVHLVATHGLFAADARQTLSHKAITSVTIADTVVREGLTGWKRLRVVSCASLLAEAIRRLHGHRSLEGLSTAG